ncbi:MAG: hypothetical protein GY788_16445, partial [bacterium]|nr:hypothetical protein [bacterium]
MSTVAGSGDQVAESATPADCPVCRALEPVHFMSIDGRSYSRCHACSARFLDPRHHPSFDDERRHYLHHENDPDDPRYRQFLSKLADP